MIKLGAQILDIYDDLHTELILEKIALDSDTDAETISKLKDYEPVASDKHAALPDEAFALVDHLPDGTKVRKFRIDTPKETLMSILYFAKTHGALDKDTAERVQKRLLEAADTFNVKVPKNVLDDLGIKLSNAKLDNSSTPQETSMDNVNKVLADQIESYKLGEDPYAEYSTESLIDTFNRDYKNMNFESRIKLANEIASREEFIEKTASDIMGLTEIYKYAVGVMDPEWAELNISKRSRMVKDAEEAIDELYKIAAEGSTEKLADALEYFDRSTGLSAQWNKTIPDPYESILGNYAVEENDNDKIASDIEEHPEKYEHLNKGMLTKFASGLFSLPEESDLDRGIFLAELKKAYEDTK